MPATRRSPKRNGTVRRPSPRTGIPGRGQRIRTSPVRAFNGRNAGRAVGSATRFEGRTAVGRASALVELDATPFDAAPPPPEPDASVLRGEVVGVADVAVARVDGHGACHVAVSVIDARAALFDVLGDVEAGGEESAVDDVVVAAGGPVGDEAAVVADAPDGCAEGSCVVLGLEVEVPVGVLDDVVVGDVVVEEAEED